MLDFRKKPNRAGRQRRGTDTAGPHAARQSLPELTAEPNAAVRASIADLQPLAGNRTLARLVEPEAVTQDRKTPAPAAPRAPVSEGPDRRIGIHRGAGSHALQRHASFEHLLLGQINPQELRTIPDDRATLNLVGGGQAVAVTQMNAYHVLRQERARVRAWQQQPPTSIDEGPDWDLKLVRVDAKDGGGATICTYGEMNMLADYFGSVDELRAAKADTLHKLLQTERDEYYRELGKMLDEFMGRDYVVKSEVQQTLGGWGPDRTVQVKYYLPENVEEKDEYKASDYTVPEGQSRLTDQEFDGSQRFKAVGAEKANLISMVGLESLPVGYTGLLPQDEGLTNFYGGGKGTGTAWGVTARNACHFAPESWRSWEQNHRQALDLALRSAAFRESAQGPGNSPEEKASYTATADRLANEAMLYNGFGDHYLQDSFASGHLINKTLVMQWYMEEMKSWWMMGPKGLDWVRFQQMSLTSQPDLASTDYGKTPNTQPHNPQAAANAATAQESWDIMGLKSIKASKEAKALLGAMRAFGVGTKRLTEAMWAKIPHDGYPDFPSSKEMVKYLTELVHLGLCVKLTPEKEPPVYGLISVDAPKDPQQVSGPDTVMQTATANIYHQWLNSALIQAGSGALHDHFCKQGLWVSSTADGDLFKIYGDDRLLTAGAGDGVAYAAETAQLSQDNIADTLAGGHERTGELRLTRILDRFPAYVVPNFETPGDVYNAKEFGLDKFNPPNTAPLRLDDWHDELKGYMDGKYLKSLFSTWTHHYAASIGGTLTTNDTVSPHTGEEF